jgi:hypothetical protein
MASEAEMLSPEEFGSLLTVGNPPVNISVPSIPAEHSIRLIALGYMADIQGRLRMTTPGRIRIYAGQLASEAPLPHKNNANPNATSNRLVDE